MPFIETLSHLLTWEQKDEKKVKKAAKKLDAALEKAFKGVLEIQKSRSGESGICSEKKKPFR